MNPQRIFIPLALCLLAAPCLAAPPTYTITQEWNPQSFGQFGTNLLNSINNARVVTGQYTTGSHSGGGSYTVINGVTMSYNGMSLGAQNSAGVMAGSTLSGEVSSPTRAILYANNQIRYLAGDNSYASSLNENGNVLGRGGRPEGDSWFWNAAADTYTQVPIQSPTFILSALDNHDHAAFTTDAKVYTWDAGAGLTQLPTIPGVSSFNNISLSDAGLIALNGHTPASSQIGLVRKPDGSIINFTQLLGGPTSVIDMSDNGIVLGSGGNGYFTWTQAGGFTFITLPPPGGIASVGIRPAAINDLGEIVGEIGHSVPPGSWTTHGIISPVPVPGTLGMLIASAAFARRRSRARMKQPIAS